MTFIIIPLPMRIYHHFVYTLLAKTTLAIISLRKGHFVSVQ